MKNSLVVSLIALALSAFAVVTMFVRGPLSNLAAPGSVQAAGSSSDGALSSRVEALVEENVAFRKRLSSLELSSAPSQGAPVVDTFVAREEFEVFRDEVLASLAKLPEMTTLQSPEFEERLALALAEIRQEEALSAALENAEGRAGNVNRTIAILEPFLDLTPDQSNAMRAALLARFEREGEFLRRHAAGEDPEVLDELKASDREIYRKDLAAFLTPAQLDHMDRGGEPMARGSRDGN